MLPKQVDNNLNYVFRKAGFQIAKSIILYMQTSHLEQQHILQLMDKNIYMI